MFIEMLMYGPRQESRTLPWARCQIFLEALFICNNINTNLNKNTYTRTPIVLAPKIRASLLQRNERNFFPSSPRLSKSKARANARCFECTIFSLHCNGEFWRFEMYILERTFQYKIIVRRFYENSYLFIKRNAKISIFVES